MAHIVILGTCDTKLHELLYLRSQILSGPGNPQVTLVDVGRTPTTHEHITVSQPTLVRDHGPKDNRNPDLQKLSRGEVIKFMTTCATSYLTNLLSSSAIHGVISAGGTGGTSLASAAMRAALPIGFPKLIVSTAASGDTGPIVGESDVTLMYSVVDIAGTNSLLRRVLGNAAGGIGGMAEAYRKSLDHAAEGQEGKERKKRVGLTMFGVTTPCIDTIRQYLEAHYEIECFVFHCTGHGGLAMEKLIAQGELDAVLDLTTTEIADHLVGGVMSAGEHRLEEGLKREIPYIIGVGAVDMVNFGPKPTVPEKFSQRNLYEHNPTITLLRTSPEENTAIAQYIVSKIKSHAKSKENVQVILPKGGVSMISTPGGPFYDEEADKALFETIEKGLEGFGVEVVGDSREVNDEGFAEMCAERLVGLMGLERRKK